MLGTLIFIVVLLILSGFFSGAETALTAASRPIMHELERNGNRRARLVNRLRQHKDRLISAILLGNNLVNILATALATGLFVSFFGAAGVVYATIAMTLLVLIFAEILPKTYAFKDANRVALALAPTVHVVVGLLTPLTRSINAVVRGLLRLFGVDYRAEEVLGSSAEELRGAIELHTAKGKAAAEERAMLRSILDLANVNVGEIMIHRKDVTMIAADLPPDQVVGEVLASPYTRIPLWRDQPDNITGVLHTKALFRAVKLDPGALAGLDIKAVAAKPWFVPETTSLLDQLLAFRKRREHFALVVDEYGSLMGIVTLEDILEEIVGEISDEIDIAVSGVSAQPDGSYIVAGNVTIRDLNRQFGWGLPDDEAATIAGLVLHESRHIPEVGQAFMFHGFRFLILRRHRNQITSIRITPAKEAAESE